MEVDGSEWKLSGSKFLLPWKNYFLIFFSQLPMEFHGNFLLPMENSIGISLP